MSVTCKDKAIHEGGERVTYLDKALMRKYGIDVKIRSIDGGSLMPPLEKMFENPTSIVVEA